MEVALVCLHETNLELLGIIDDSPDKQGRKIFNYTIQSAEAIRTLRRI